MDTLADIINQSWSLLRDRQWTNWELLIVAAVATAVLTSVIVKQRRTQLAGTNHSIEGRLAHPPGKYGRREKAREAAEQLEMEYDRIRLLQRQIMTRDQTEARLERDISDLTAANRQLQAELIIVNEQLKRESEQARQPSEKKAAELTTANKQLTQNVAQLTADNKQLQCESKQAGEASEKKAAELTTVNEQLKQEVTQLTADSKQLRRESKQAGESSESEAAKLTTVNEQLKQKVAKLTADNKQLQRESRQAEESSEKKAAKLTTVNEQLKQKVAKLTADNKQLQRESKQAGGGSKKKAAELIAANKQLKREVAKLTAENKQLQNEVAEQAEASSNGMEGRDEKRPSRVKDVVRKVPWRMRVKGRGRLLKGLSNAGNRLMHAGDRARVSQTEDILCTPKSVKAKSPMRLLDELAEEIVDLNTQMGISDGLDAKLEAIQQARDEFDANNNTATVNALRVFINAVQTDQGQDDESLQEHAEDLIDAAQEIAELIATYYV
ncbi:MAG: hypothetical protein ISS70_00910 [Phycisphaerae bacterium]|nr:hypothetical protein [Phycisphaerae bacterium]